MKFFSDLALSATAPDNFLKLVSETKYLYNQLFEFYSSTIENNPWVIFDIGQTRKVTKEKFKSKKSILNNNIKYSGDLSTRLKYYLN